MKVFLVVNPDRIAADLASPGGVTHLVGARSRYIARQVQRGTRDKKARIVQVEFKDRLMTGKEFLEHARKVSPDAFEDLDRVREELEG